jgi:ribosomal protein S8E
MRTILTAKCHKKKKKRKFWFGNRPKQQQQQPPQKMIIIRECVGFCFLIYSSRYTSGPMVGRFAGSILFLRLLL